MEHTIYAYCFRNMQDRVNYHQWRSEIEGVTSAVTVASLGLTTQLLLLL